MVTKSKIRKMIAKEEFSNYKYAESMARTPTQEHLIKKIFFLLKKNRSQKEESEVINHADSMACTPKKSIMILQIGGVPLLEM